MNIMEKISFSGFLILVVKKMNLIFQLILGAAWAPVHQITVIKVAFLENKSFVVSCNTMLIIHSLAGRKGCQYEFGRR